MRACLWRSRLSRYRLGLYNMCSNPGVGANLVWIGNIPYEAREEDLEQWLSTVGPVASVRISVDKESGQSKGFAFCEYEDPECCALAVANLNGTMFGGRMLRLDYSSNDQLRHENRQFTSTPHLSLTSTLATNHPCERSSSARSLRGIEGSLNPSQTGSQNSDVNAVRVEICSIVQSLTASQLLYILGHMQRYIMNSPQAARALLRGNPALCYAIVHAQFICGMIDERFTAPASDAMMKETEKDTERRQAEALQYFYQTHAQALELEAEKHARMSCSSLIEPPSSMTPTPSSFMRKSSAVQSEKVPAPFPRSNFGDTRFLSEDNCEESMSLGSVFHPVPSQQQSPIHSQPLCHVTPASVPEDTHTPYVEPHSVPGVLDQLMACPQLVQQIFSVTPEQEAQWTSEERKELQAVRDLLTNQQLLSSLSSKTSYPPPHHST